MAEPQCILFEEKERGINLHFPHEVEHIPRDCLRPWWIEEHLLARLSKPVEMMVYRLRYAGAMADLQLKYREEDRDVMYFALLARTFGRLKDLWKDAVTDHKENGPGLLPSAMVEFEHWLEGKQASVAKFKQ